MKESIPYINIHTHHEQAADVMFIFNAGTDFSQTEKSRFISVGIHPWHIGNYTIPETLQKLELQAADVSVKAIGECGLDRLIETPLKEQEAVFTEQIRIAEVVQKPLIIHCVKAFDELIRIKKEQKITVPVIIHGYTNNEQIAEKLLKNGMYLSFGKALLMEGSNARKIMVTVPYDRFFLETDDAAVSIKSIFEKAAELKEISVEELKEKMMLNFKRLFNYE